MARLLGGSGGSTPLRPLRVDVHGNLWTLGHPHFLAHKDCQDLSPQGSPLPFVVLRRFLTQPRGGHDSYSDSFQPSSHQVGNGSRGSQEATVPGRPLGLGGCVLDLGLHSF